MSEDHLACSPSIKTIPCAKTLEPGVDPTGSRILVLADDPAVYGVIRHWLLLEHLIVEFVPSSQAFEQIQGALDKFDLLIIDAALPNGRGLDRCRQIRQEHPLFKLPILMVTSRSRPEDTLAALSAGANDTLAAPVNVNELHVRVRHLLLIKASAAEFVRMELTFLQNQIKPHFLYNTLNSIAALSEMDQAVMRRLLDRFGAYLRESLRRDNLEPLIPLHQEMQLVHSYLEIEKIRFNDRLHTTFAISDDVCNVRIPPRSIQSLVENAVRHGLMARKQGGNLSVSALAEEGACLVRVQDDGVGMAQTANAWYKHGFNSLGGSLAHIDRRLKTIYGTGLNIVSTAAVGTRISFTIPSEGGLPRESHLNG